MSELRSTAFALFAGLLLASPGVAANFCVTSSSQLANALATAETNGENDFVRIVEGTYLAPQPDGFVYEPFQLGADATRNLTVSGGFEPGCASQVPDARRTVLSGGLLSPVLYLRSIGGQMLVINLTVTGGYSATSIGAVDVARTPGTLADGPTVRIENVLFRHNEGYAALRVATAAPLRLLGSLFHSNRVRHAAARLVVTAAEGSLTVHSNTVAATEAEPGFQTAGIAFDLAAGATTTVVNNVLWDNESWDFHLVGTMVPFSWNVYGVAGGLGTYGGNGNLQTDPRFVDATADDYRLRHDSPAVDSGGPVDPTQTYDLYGTLRPQNQILDRGALERIAALFLDGFESGGPWQWSVVVP